MGQSCLSDLFLRNMETHILRQVSVEDATNNIFQHKARKYVSMFLLALTFVGLQCTSYFLKLKLHETFAFCDGCTLKLIPRSIKPQNEVEERRSVLRRWKRKRRDGVARDFLYLRHGRARCAVSNGFFRSSRSYSRHSTRSFSPLGFSFTFRRRALRGSHGRSHHFR